MKNFVTIYIALLFLLAGTRAAGAEYSDKTLTKALKIADKLWSDHEIGLEPVFIEPSFLHYSSQDTLFRLLNEESTHVGYLVLSSAKGRFDFFDFMIVYSAELEVIELRILVYRSEHGSQVSSRAWLKQFYGLPPAEDRKYGSDVDALSGATFSAKSLTEQVNRVNGLMFELSGD
ncbi:hypothetical protein ACFLTU_04745 [Bacteroidota bacterium]